MRRRLLGISAAGLAAVVGITAWLQQEPAAQYQPAAQAGESYEAQGAWDYLHKMRANQVTGEIDQADVVAARQAVAGSQTRSPLFHGHSDQGRHPLSRHTTVLRSSC